MKITRMKKTLVLIAGTTFLGMSAVIAQRRPGTMLQPYSNSAAVQRSCMTPAPDAAWETWFSTKVEEYKKNQGINKTEATYTIPVIVHILHNGDAAGVNENITAAQVQSQITVLNNDYGGTGAGTVPSVFQAAKAGNTGVQFCLAVKDVNGAALAEPGIERINWSSKGWPNPATQSSSGLQSSFDGTIKPASIWDPTKYLNIWICDAAASGLLGYASFPAATGLTGLTGVENSQTCGVVIAYDSFGTIGKASAPYNGGRTATHEIGHWLGLRHIWGDGNCLTDYCSDTPPAQTSNFGCPTHPFHLGTCSGNTTGEMFMNYMDYTDDGCMSLFTGDQKTRIQTAMANGTYRKLLGTHGLCSSSAQAPVANFSFPASICAGVASAFTNTSQNLPTSYLWAVTPNTGVTITSPTSQNPSITFTTPASYTVSLTATNAQGSNSITKPVTVINCTVTGCDTISPMSATDSLYIHLGDGGGYIFGNNSYDDREKAQYYSSAGLTSSQVTGGIILFYKDAAANRGTTGSANIQVNMYSGNNTGGPSGAALISHSVSLSTITALSPVQGVTYCGDPGLQFNSAIIYPYSFNFTTPQNITGDFLMSIVLPANGSDTVSVLASGVSAPNPSAWEKWNDNTWHSLNDGTSNSWQLNSSMALLPKVNCPLTIGVQDVNSLNNNLAVFPNPGNGLLNMVCTLPHLSDLNIKVGNALGQIVYTRLEKGITNSIVNIDLTTQPKGMYMLTISDGNSLVTKKIMIN